jgi:hypothetical protein
MAKGLRQRRISIGLVLAFLVGGRRLTIAQTLAEQGPRCTCGDGRSLEAGVVSYSQNSGRETITRIETEAGTSGNRCRALWLGSTEIRPVGTPYQFHLERTALKERRIDECDYPSERFVRRTKTYEFVLDANTVSIREMRIARPADGARIPESDPQAQSNSNLWNSIAGEAPAESDERVKRAYQIDSTRAFNRRSWILARTEIKAHYVGVVKDGYDVERLVPLKGTRKVKAGQLGQIEAVGASRAIVRFYEGSRIEKFGRATNAFRRWYDRVGGPYLETKDDLYTPLRARILEVSLDDIVEINDYLDQEHTDRT